MNNSTKSPKLIFLQTCVNHLKDIIDNPPYLVFLFIGFVLSIISFFWQKDYIVFSFVILIYSIIGNVWRHATKDVRGRIKEFYKESPKKFNKINLWLTTIYQLINILLVILLVIILKGLKIWY